MDPPWPPLLISRSPWNFYQFLSSDVSRSSFLKLPEDPGRFFFLTVFLIVFFYCLSTELSTVSFSLFHFVRSFRSSLISYFPLSSAHTFSYISTSSLLTIRLRSLILLSFFANLFLSRSSSVISFYSLAISFSSSPTRWFPTISPSDFLLLFLLRPRQGSRREITLIN